MYSILFAQHAFTQVIYPGLYPPPLYTHLHDAYWIQCICIAKDSYKYSV